MPTNKLTVKINKLWHIQWNTTWQFEGKNPTNTQNNMGESQKLYAVLKRPNSEAYLIYYSMYFIFSKRQNYGNRKKIGGCSG